MQQPSVFAYRASVGPSWAQGFGYQMQEPAPIGAEGHEQLLRAGAAEGRPSNGEGDQRLFGGAQQADA
jgi:hypothetical protein